MVAVGDERIINEHRKVVVKAVDEDTGDVLYEHIGTGECGVEWDLGVLVVERGIAKRQLKEEANSKK